MIANFHTHTTFCDGKNTPEEIVIHAINKGFDAIGFSGHGYTPFDLRYCMQDTEGYLREIRRLQVKYQKDIQIYAGVEEDAFSPLTRSNFDYIIGSSHYFLVNGQYFPIDSNYDYFKKCLEAFNDDIPRLAETYYQSFCAYIHTRKPDIIGHFDLITKFDEIDTPRFLNNGQYKQIAVKYTEEAAKSGCLFEVNTGAIARNLRTAPYPSEDLLYILKKAEAGLVLASDSHTIETLDFGFEDAKAYLKEIGFKHVYGLLDGAFKKDIL
ncbi:MAG: histidinol-phosphatase [Clostridia bacterium]|nr:histidinol-phosphatase [Clostridia bacterium]